MGDTMHPAIIHLIGPDGSGKTTLCRLFFDAFTGKSVLAVDASPDGFLALSYGIPAPMTVATLLKQIDLTPMTHEAMDWALQDLPVTVPAEAEAEVLAWGHLPEPLSPVQRERLAYGLPRLLRTYDIVIWDGPMGITETMFAPADIRPLIVITPQDEDYCRQLNINRAMVLLSKAEATDVLPATAARHVVAGNWRFLGKLPPLAPAERRVRELPEYFQEFFHKLDLPFELRS